MLEPVFAPPHADTLEALLNEPLPGTFHHPGAQQYTQPFVRRVLDVVAMARQGCRHLCQRLARRVKARLALHTSAYALRPLSSYFDSG